MLRLADQSWGLSRRSSPCFSGSRGTTRCRDYAISRWPRRATSCHRAPRKCSLGHDLMDRTPRPRPGPTRSRPGSAHGAARASSPAAARMWSPRPARRPREPPVQRRDEEFDREGADQLILGSATARVGALQRRHRCERRECHQHGYVTISSGAQWHSLGGCRRRWPPGRPSEGGQHWQSSLGNRTPAYGFRNASGADAAAADDAPERAARRATGEGDQESRSRRGRLSLASARTGTPTRASRTEGRT